MIDLPYQLTHSLTRQSVNSDWGSGASISLVLATFNDEVGSLHILSVTTRDV